MLGFLRGEADCLVTTTIIESGLDIPTANTLIVERADQLGLSQAYQIRGRVGRSRERAFAYLLYPSAEALTEEAAARLSTLADHTELGSGFRIAMRDLDIRGAGDLLGDEQSGHVAAVGFELYCQMIDEAVAEAGGGGRGGRGGAGAGPPRRPGRRLPAGLLRPLRGGEDRRPPPHRRRPRAGRAAGDPRRAERPLRPAAAAGGEPAGAAAGADRAAAWPGRAASSSAAGGSASPGSSSTPSRPASCASRSRGRSTSGARRPPRCASPTSPRRGWPRCWRWPRRCARRDAQSGRSGYAAQLRESEPGQETHDAARVGAKRRRRARLGPCAAAAARACSVFGVALRRPLRRLRDRRGHRPPERPLRRRRAGRGRARATSATITEAEFKHALVQAAAAGRAEKSPRNRATKNTKN